MYKRTNYQQKEAFSKKPPRAMSHRYVVEELDAIVRLILQKLESCCFTCGTAKHLQVSHLFERRHLHTRFDTLPSGGNNRLMCARCNQNHEAHPNIYRNKFIQVFGESAYDDLVFRSRSKQKLTYSDLLELLQEKEEQLKKLKGKAA